MSQAHNLDFESVTECSVEEYHGRARPQQEQEQLSATKRSTPDLPENLADRFFESKGTYYFPDRSPAFAEKDGKLTMRTKELNPEVVKAFVTIAEDRGWNSLKVTGTKEFRQAVWLEAARRGLEVNGYTPTETEKAWAERQAKQHNAVMEDRDKKRDSELDFEQKRSQNDPDRAAMLRAGDKSTIRDDSKLAKAFAGVAAAWQAAKRRFREPEQQQKFVAGVQERYAQKIEQGQDIQGPPLRRASVVQFKEAAVAAARSDAAAPTKAKPQTEKQRLAEAISSFTPPDPQALLKNRSGTGKLARRLIEGGMSVGEATTAVAFNALVFSHAPELHARMQPQNPLKMDPADLAQNYRDRVGIALAGLPEATKTKAVRMLKQHIEGIDKNTLLREAQQKAATVESPQLNGRNLDTRNPSDFGQFLRAAKIPDEIASRLIREREALRDKNSLGYAKALQEERQLFEKNHTLSERDRNSKVAEYLVAKSERARTERQTEQKERAPSERNKDMERQTQAQEHSTRSKEVERQAPVRKRSEQERGR